MVALAAALNGSSLSLQGFAVLSRQRVPVFAVLLLALVFVLLSDLLVVGLVLSRRSLRRPMFVFMAALLLNSVLGSLAIYPQLLWGLLQDGAAPVPPSACLLQAFVVSVSGASSFLLLALMALDRYLSICRPLRYGSVMTPGAVAALLSLSWLLPVGVVGGFTLLVGRLRLCRLEVGRLFCDIYSFIALSCRGPLAALADVFGLCAGVLLMFLPSAFVVFSYARILLVCLRRSSAFNGRALATCLPHLLVFCSYVANVAYEFLGRRLLPEPGDGAALAVSLGMLVAQTVFNPVIYGLKTREIFAHMRALLSCRRSQQE